MTETKIVNLTPHAIVLQAADGTQTTIPPSRQVARVATKPGQKLDPTLDGIVGIPCACYSATSYGQVEGLAAPSVNIVYIVSGLVLSALAAMPDGIRSLSDVFGPGTGPNDGAVRDEGGRIVAVTRLVRAC